MMELLIIFHPHLQFVALKNAKKKLYEIGCEEPLYSTIVSYDDARGSQVREID